MASVLYTQGNISRARSYIEQALALHEQNLGPDHPDTAWSLVNVSMLVREQGDLAAARPYYERALTIFTARLGAEHPYTQTVQRNLAALDAAQEDGEG